MLTGGFDNQSKLHLSKKKQHLHYEKLKKVLGQILLKTYFEFANIFYNITEISKHSFNYNCFY